MTNEIYKHIPVPFGLKICQLAVFESKARFRVLAAGRRFGKTYLALVELLRAANEDGAQSWYVAPTYRQAKRIAWRRLKALTREYWSGRPNETDLSIQLASGGSIALRGADNPDSLRGDGLDFVVLDEFASMRPECWSEVIRPSLADKQGRALFIGTPLGCNHFYDRFEQAAGSEGWESFHFTTLDGQNVTSEELAGAAAELDSLTYQQEFEAQFTAAGRNRVYYPFQRAVHVKPLSFWPPSPLIWSLDFNVNPMCALLIQLSGDAVHVLDEIVLSPTGSTSLACEAFRKKAELFPRHTGTLKVEVYGDASGNQRATSADRTDLTIIREFFATWKGTYEPYIRLNSANPAVRERVNCVNSRLENASGERRLFVDAKCKELIKDLEQVRWAESGDIDKSDRMRTHLSDALGYYVSQAFPLRGKIGERQTGRLL